MEAPSNAIVIRIQKLLALAGNNPNEHERAVAMQRAQELMQEHNLSIGQVKTEDEKLAIIDAETSITTDNWKTWTVMAAAKLYYCKPYKSGRKLHLIGSPVNVEVATDVAKWLIDSLNKEAKTVRPDQRRSFCIGASIALLERAEEMIQAEQTASTNEQHVRRGGETAHSYALVVVRNKLENANEQWAKQNLDLGKGRPSRYRADAEGFERGQAYGRSVNLNKQIGSSGTRRING